MATKGLTILVIAFGLGSSSFASLGLGPVNMATQSSQSPKDKSGAELSCGKLSGNDLTAKTTAVRTAARTTMTKGQKTR